MISYLLDKNFQNNDPVLITFKVESFISTNIVKNKYKNIITKRKLLFYTQFIYF